MLSGPKDCFAILVIIRACSHNGCLLGSAPAEVDVLGLLWQRLLTLAWSSRDCWLLFLLCWLACTCSCRGHCFGQSVQDEILYLSLLLHWSPLCSCSCESCCLGSAPTPAEVTGSGLLLWRSPSLACSGRGSWPS